MKDAANEPSCDSIRGLLALHACDALEPAETARVEAHLARCAACRLEADAFAAVREQLSSWEEPLDAVDPRSAARSAIGRERGRLLRRRRAMFAAAAAALLVAVLALFALGGARARVADGALELAFGRPPARADSRALDERVEARARAVAAELVEARASELARANEARFAELESAFERDRRALLAAFDAARAADRELVRDALAHLAREGARETRETREALIDLVAYAARRDAP